MDTERPTGKNLMKRILYPLAKAAATWLVRELQLREMR